ncbi:hypothetical protein PG994_014165 [Apiospora phragmitis]|uniref:Transposase n=1 Tax=Apiospora phragmitis TaxID=2905665 RepID=A0ABR1T3J1_9PEZI
MNLQSRARDWCFTYEPDKAKGNRTVVEFQKKAHFGRPVLGVDGSRPQREPDNPVAPFHSDLFNAGVGPDYYHFCLEQSRTGNGRRQ